MEALQRRWHNHNQLVTAGYLNNTAVKLRAEDGRSVRNVDISMFINDLRMAGIRPAFQRWMPARFSSCGVVEYGSGDTAVIDREDTSATNFMVQDALMQQVFPGERADYAILSSGCAHL